MALLNQQDLAKLQKVLDTMTNEVRILYFTQELECQYCRLTHELLEEIAALNPKIKLFVYDFLKETDLVKQYDIQRLPAIVILGERDYGIRFYGVPGGYEFTSLIEDIVDASRNDPHLPQPILAELEKVTHPITLDIFVSPTCPYCPRMVRAAHRFAMANPHITARMVDIPEFPELAVKYNIQGVPHTVINEEFSVSGAVPDMQLAKKLVEVSKESLKIN
jgi:glutaredoxin-like protein